MELHRIQREILKELSFRNEMSFSNFQVKDTVETDLFNYHLQTLVKSGLISKDDDKKYSLSELGKSTIQYMDVSDNMDDVKMPKVTVVIFLVNNYKVLLSKRLRHPFKDFLGFASGKVQWGEQTEVALKRACVSELGVVPTKSSLYAIRRCVDVNVGNESVIHDAIYYVYRITDFEGEVINTNVSQNIWFDFEELKSLEILPVTKDIVSEYQGTNVSDVFYKAMETRSLEL
jgi:ADP-ribose pyrophosphatase YjhB (NUDIX family)/predicted transcriptional regulator